MSSAIKCSSSGINWAVTLGAASRVWGRQLIPVNEHSPFLIVSFSHMKWGISAVPAVRRLSYMEQVAVTLNIQYTPFLFLLNKDSKNSSQSSHGQFCCQRSSKYSGGSALFYLISGLSVSHAHPAFVSSVRLSVFSWRNLSGKYSHCCFCWFSKMDHCQVVSSISAALCRITLPTTNVNTSKFFFTGTAT